MQFPTSINTIDNIDYFGCDDIGNWLSNLKIEIYSVNFKISALDCYFIKIDKNKKYSHAGEHIVFYGELYNKLNKKIMDIVVKFYHLKIFDTKTKQLKEIYVKKFTRNHGDQLIKNYDHLRQYLNFLNIKNIIVNDIIIAKTDFTALWIEKYINKYDRFTDTNYSDWIVRTNVEILNNLQLEIYFSSKKQYTLIDLQGGYDENGNYILSDIEYTNTMEKMGWNSKKLLDLFIDVNKIKIENKRKAITSKELERIRRNDILENERRDKVVIGGGILCLSLLGVLFLSNK